MTPDKDAPRFSCREPSRASQEEKDAAVSAQAWIATIHERCAGAALSPVHGDHHWRCVAATGHYLIRAGEPADPAVVLAFALLHDSQRHNDAHDPEHGARAGRFAEQLHRDGVLDLSRQQLRLLIDACEHHTGGPPNPDPTVAVCWDSDRLNLCRIGAQVDATWISTLSALDEATIAWVRHLEARTPTWDQIIVEFAALGPVARERRRCADA